MNLDRKKKKKKRKKNLFLKFKKREFLGFFFFLGNVEKINFDSRDLKKINYYFIKIF